MAELVSFENLKGCITNSDLKLEALVFQESIFLGITKAPAWRTPTLGSDNTPTFYWAFNESATINPVVADLLRIWSSHNRHHRISLSVFYPPVSLNPMANGASRRFNIYPYGFFALFYSTYNPQYPGLWKLCHPPTEVIYSVISNLFRRLYKAVTYPTAVSSPYKASSSSYAITSSWNTCS